MRLLRRLGLLGVAALLASLALLADPEPPSAKATSVPCIGISPGGAVGEVFGLGNPLGDACEAVTDPILGAAGEAVIDPLSDAAGAIGQGVFDKVTGWVAEGAVWLIGEVAGLSEKTTAPNLRSKGFIKQYRLMTTIAALMAALMLIFAVFESLGRGDPGMLWRVFLINAPLAAIATSAAYVVVQLLVASCDVMSATISRSTGANSEKFLKGVLDAVAVLGGVGGSSVQGASGAAAGAVAVPMFVALIAIAVAAFAAFFVWIELLMRDAAIYVVALFMPLGIAASIWPRWTSALRRTCELVIVLVFSKFVIVAIIALAASMLAENEGSIEHVLAAAAMLLLACFSPFVLFKLVPFAEGAMSAAAARQSAASGAVRTVELANSMMMVQRLSRANWAAASSREGGGSEPGGSAGGGGKKTGGGDPQGDPGGGGEAAAASGAAAGGVAVVGAPAKAAEGAKDAGERLGHSDEARAAAGGGESQQGAGASAGSSTSPGEEAPRPKDPRAASTEGAGGPPPGGEGTAAQRARGGSSGAAVAEPTEAKGGNATSGGGASTPRPAAETGTSGPKAGPA
jgi:hypothetical protein